MNNQAAQQTFKTKRRSHKAARAFEVASYPIIDTIPTFVVRHLTQVYQVASIKGGVSTGECMGLTIYLNLQI